MTLELIEGAVDAVKEYLETNIAAKLNELDVEYGDLALADIKEWYINETRGIPAYPSIYVLGNYSEVISEQANVYMNAAHNITLVVFVGDQSLTTLKRRLYRYVRAVVELLIAARSSAGWNRIINFERFVFSPTYTEGGTFLADAHVEITVALNEAV